jgi:hypothetical protein
MRVEKLWQQDRTSADAYGKEEISKSWDSHLSTDATAAGT